MPIAYLVGFYQVCSNNDYVAKNGAIWLHPGGHMFYNDLYSENIKKSSERFNRYSAACSHLISL